MKFDVIIIGGGLSGLTAGIALTEAGKDVAIVSAGQSSLHFNGGYLDLLGYDGKDNEVFNPLKGIESLDSGHPYKKVGDAELLASNAKQLLLDAGIETVGEATVNHWRITPVGGLMPAWLSLKGMAMVDDCDNMPWKRVALVNFINYLDFPTKLIAAGLRDRGVDVDIKAISVPELEALRQSPSEMRATNIAKIIECNDIILKIADEINSKVDSGCDMVLLPAVLGISSTEKAGQLLRLINSPSGYVSTLPPSVAGVRMQSQLRKRFDSLGGTFIVGDKVVDGIFDDDRLTALKTEKLEDTLLCADNFVLCSGSFMSRGLVADYTHVYEPALGVDIDNRGLERKDWAVQNVYDAQPYMEIGVKTNDNFNCLKSGRTITNLYAAGSILSGHNSIKMHDGTGVDMLTALQVVTNIIK